MFDKHNILEQIITFLTAEWETLSRATQDSQQGATHEETQAKSKYDTFAIEASYLAQGQAKRMAELEWALDLLKKLNLQAFNSQTPITTSALIKLKKTNGKPHWVFLAPDAGGTKVKNDGIEITVVTTKSPLGKALLGARQGDSIEIDQGETGIEYEVLEVL